MRPLIGISFQDEHGEDLYGVCRRYVDYLDAAGAASVMLLPRFDCDVAGIVEHLDGVLLPGGADINANIAAAWDSRDMFELELAKYCFDYDVPMLGICRGAQVMSVALGGEVCDIAELSGEHFEHEGELEVDGMRQTSHMVSVYQTTRLADILQCPALSTNSAHSQAVDKPGRSIEVSARASDNTIEAIEAFDKSFFVGVQWHPEAAGEALASRRLANAFVGACKARHSAKIERMSRWI